VGPRAGLDIAVVKSVLLIFVPIPTSRSTVPVLTYLMTLCQLHKLQGVKWNGEWERNGNDAECNNRALMFKYYKDVFLKVMRKLQRNKAE